MSTEPLHSEHDKAVLARLNAQDAILLQLQGKMDKVVEFILGETTPGSPAGYKELMTTSMATLARHAEELTATNLRLKALELLPPRLEAVETSYKDATARRWQLIIMACGSFLGMVAMAVNTLLQYFRGH